MNKEPQKSKLRQFYDSNLYVYGSFLLTTLTFAYLIYNVYKNRQQYKEFHEGIEQVKLHEDLNRMDGYLIREEEQQKSLSEFLDFDSISSKEKQAVTKFYEYQRIRRDSTFTVFQNNHTIKSLVD